MHISIAGKLGSGKSTICKALQQDHGFEIYSTGAVQREVAKEMGISTLELNQRMMSDPALDHVIDDAVAKISRERPDDPILFDSRMAWHFAERTFKIFVVIDPLIAAQRVMANPRGSEETYQDVYEARDKLLERGRVENARFREIYQVDNFDYRNYDLILDTSYATPAEVCDTLWAAYEAYQEAPWDGPRMMLCPRSLYPTLPLAEADGNETVGITARDGRHLIVHGHKAVGEALRRGDVYLRAELAEGDVARVSDAELAAYEAAYGIHYAK